MLCRFCPESLVLHLQRAFDLLECIFAKGYVPSPNPFDGTKPAIPKVPSTNRLGVRLCLLTSAPLPLPGVAKAAGRHFGAVTDGLGVAIAEEHLQQATKGTAA